MPVTAILSILHRVSGVLLFLSFPVGVYFFDLSLRGPVEFEKVKAVMTGSVGFVLVEAVILWALVHHLLAGIRYLVLDLGIGSDRNTARMTAMLVLWVEAAVALAFVFYCLSGNSQ